MAQGRNAIDNKEINFIVEGNCPERNVYFAQSLRYAQIVILEILSYIPVVKIFACLYFEQNISFMDGYLVPFN